MQEIRSHFLEAAARPFEDNLERKANAKAWLDENTHDAAPAGMVAATARWNHLARMKHHSPWRKILISITLLLTLGLWFPARKAYQETMNLLTLGTTAGNPATIESIVFRNLDDRDRLLLGNPSLPEDQRALSLWQSNPESPAFFSEYAAAYRRVHNRLPDDYTTTAATLDPDNAWFILFEAAAIGTGTVERIKKTASEKNHEDAPRRWKITDRENYLRALEILTSLDGKTRCVSYSKELLKRRISLLPQATPSEHLASVAYLAGMKSNFMPLLKLGELLSARAAELGEIGDAGELRRFRDELEKLIRLLSHSDASTLVDELTVRMVISMPLRNFHESAVKLGIDHEEPRFSTWNERFTRVARETRERKKEPSPIADKIVREGSILASLAMPVGLSQVKQPPPPTSADLAPTRYSDHASLSRISATVLWVLFLISMGIVFLYRFRASPMIRSLSEQVIHLLRPIDWAWIIGGGVVIPCFAVFAVAAFTPLGGRELSITAGIDKTAMFLPTSQFFMLFNLVVLLAVILGRWRLRRRAAMFGFRGKDLTGWFSVAILLIILPTQLYLPKNTVLALAWIPHLWLLTAAARAVFGKPRHILRRLVVSRVLLVSLASAVLCAIPAVWAFGFANQYWFEKDRFMKLSVKAPSVIPYEHRLTREYRRETLEVLQSD